MVKTLQRILLVVGVVALVVLLAEIIFSISATMHGKTPVRILHMNAGPYPLTVSLYKETADAGYAFPFAISSTQREPVTYEVTTVPSMGVDGTPVRATLSPDVTVHNGIQGMAEITVQGLWMLHIVADGPAGKGQADIPVTATAPPAIPEWMGWFIGLIPLFALVVFLVFLKRPHVRLEPDEPVTKEVAESYHRSGAPS